MGLGGGGGAGVVGYKCSRFFSDFKISFGFCVSGNVYSYCTFHLIDSPLPETDIHTLSAHLMRLMISHFFFFNSAKGQTLQGCESLNDIKNF